MRQTNLILALFFMIIVSSAFLSAQEKSADPVNWRELVGFLIDFPDWEATDDASGQTMNMMQYKVTQVERDYISGDKEMSISIIDGAMVQMVYAGFKMMMQFEVDSSDEFVKKLEIKGFPGIEKYNYDDKAAEVIVLAGDRFLVQIEIDNAPDTKEAKEIAELLDLEKIATLAQK